MPATARRGRRAVRRIGLVAAATAAGLAAWMWAPAPWRPRVEPMDLGQIREAAVAGRWDVVEVELGRRLDADPADGQARVMRAMALVNLQRPDDALEVLRGVPASHPARSRAVALAADLAWRSRRAADAERACRELAALDPKAVEPRQRLISLLTLGWRHGEAREVLWEVYRASGDPRTLVDLILNLWAYENDARVPIAELDGFLAVTPTDPFLRRARGLALLMAGRAAEALPDLEAAAEALVDDPVGRFALAECLLALGRFRGDESILGERPDPPADASRWWVFRGRLLEASGRPEAAPDAYRAAIRANPRDPEAHYRLGQALIRLGRPDEARGHLERASAIKAQHESLRRAVQEARKAGFEADPSPYIALGRLCREAGLDPEARAWFELAEARGSGPARDALDEIERDPAVFPIALSRPTLARSPAMVAAATGGATPSEGSGQLRLEDVAAAAGVDYRYDCAARGNQYLGDTMGGGVGLIDFDGDGRIDLYFVNGCTLPYDPASPPAPNVLYRNRGDGTFEDVTARAGLGGRGYGMGCAVGDYDGDGRDDLFVTGLGSTVLYRNRGDGTFEDVTARAGVASDRWTTAAGFADLDGDADLDLVVVTYVDADPAEVPDCRDATGRPLHCSPTRFPAQADLLFRNEGDGTFVDVSGPAGFDAVTDGRGLGLAIADFDEDGRLDIFVANDLSPDLLFLNRGGLRFEESGMTAGVALNGSGRATASMGVVADDLDGDGRLDLFVTNFLNEPNTLFRGLGGGLFADATLQANLYASSLAVTGFGVAAPDLDNDGRPDLVIADGHVDDQPWVNSPMAQPPLAYLGRDGGRFDLAGPGASPYLSRKVVGRGLAAGDLDDDGRVDLVVVHRDAPASILRNRTPGGHWLGLRLRGTRSGPLPVGARVTCRAGGRTQVRVQSSGTGYLSAHEPTLRFGLGQTARVESLHVRWPSGLEQSWSDLEVDRVFELREGEDPEVRDAPGTPPDRG